MFDSPNNLKRLSYRALVFGLVAAPIMYLVLYLWDPESASWTTAGISGLLAGFVAWGWRMYVTESDDPAGNQANAPAET